MGHQQSRNQEVSNYHSGDSSSGQTYLSLPLRTISSMIIVFAVAFLASCITASIVTPVQNSDAATRIQVNSASTAFYVNIASGNNSGSVGLVSKDIQATITGTRGVATDALTVTSNVPNGYKVYVSMAENEDGQKLVYYGDSTNQGTNKNANYFLGPNPNGSWESPAGLTTDNTWGVAVAGSVNSKFSSASEYTDGTILSTTKFAPVPAYGSEQLLFETTGQQNPNAPNTVNVYYGYYANAALPSGTYKNLVLYTAWAESVSGSGVATYTGNVNYNNGELAEADQKEFVFITSLFTDRTVSKDAVTVTITDAFSGTTDTCNVRSVGKDSNTNDAVRINCKAPSVSRPGIHSARIQIAGYGFDATTTVKYGTPGIVAMVGGVETTITKMQEMTSSFCSAWTGGMDTKYPSYWDTTLNAPKAFASGTTPVWRWGNDGIGILGVWDLETQSSRDAAWSTHLALGYIDNINKSVPEGFLEDSRDGNIYRIRKLADGNCWMTENLRLVFADDAGQIGVVQADGSIIGNGQHITQNNSNVGQNAVGGASASLFEPSSFNASVAYTEVSENNTTWASSMATKHPTNNDTSGLTQAQKSDNSQLYARSFYHDLTSGECINEDTNQGSYDCHIGDNDVQMAGTLYNWKLATAGTGGTSAQTPVTNHTMSDSICPAGFRLPDLDSAKDLGYLATNIYAANKVPYNNVYSQSTRKGMEDYYIAALARQLRKAPFSLFNSGIYNLQNGVSSSKADIYLWTGRTASTDSYESYTFTLSGSSLIFSKNYSSRGNGFSIRCVSI